MNYTTMFCFVALGVYGAAVLFGMLTFWHYAHEEEEEERTDDDDDDETDLLFGRVNEDEDGWVV